VHPMRAKLYTSLAEAIQEGKKRGFTCFLRRGSVACVPTRSPAIWLRLPASVVPANLYPRKKEGAMGSKLFLDGLPPLFSTQQLMDLLAPFGTVLSALVMIDPAGKSLCMGKVEMSTPRDAERAIQKLHRSHLQGRLLLVFKQRNQGGSTGQEKKGAP